VPCAFWTLESGVSRLRWHPTTLKAVSQVLDVDSTSVEGQTVCKKNKKSENLVLNFLKRRLGRES
jgi:hypothetical protein